MSTHKQHAHKRINLAKNEHSPNITSHTDLKLLHRIMQSPSRETLTPTVVTQIQRMLGNKATIDLLSTGLNHTIQRKVDIEDLSEKNVKDVLTALQKWHDVYDSQKDDKDDEPFRQPSYAKHEVQSMISALESYKPDGKSKWNPTFSIAIEDGEISAVRKIGVMSGSLDLIVANPSRDKKKKPNPVSKLIEEFSVRKLGAKGDKPPKLRAEIPSLIPMYQNRFGYRLTDESWSQIRKSNKEFKDDKRKYPDIIKDEEVKNIINGRLEMQQPDDEREKAIKSFKI